LEPEREQQAFLEARKPGSRSRAEAVKKGQPAPKPRCRSRTCAWMTPGGLFNGVIAPLVPYTIRGCIWYQGERNSLGPLTGYYGAQLQTLMRDWRARWAMSSTLRWYSCRAFQRGADRPDRAEGVGRDCPR